MRSRKLAKIRAEFGPVHAIWFLPELAIAVPLSIPVGLVFSAIVKRRERSFKNEMKASNRVMNDPDFEQALQEGRGRLIIERHSLKGPVRWWWTAECVLRSVPSSVSHLAHVNAER